MTRLLVIAAEFPPAGGGGVTRVAKLVKYLARADWEITVICADEAAPAISDEQLLKAIPPTVTIRRIKGPFRFVGSAGPRVSAIGGAGGLRSLLVRTIKTAVRWFAVPDRWVGWAWRVGRLSPEEAGNPEVILVSGPPHSAYLAASRLSRRLGVPYMIDLRDTWYSNPAYRTGAPWQAWFDRRLEARAVRGASALVVVAPTSVAEYQRRYPKANVVLIPNGFDAEDFDHALPIRRTSDDIEFLHAGSLYARHGNEFFRAFAEAAMTWQGPGRLVFRQLGPILPQIAAAARELVPAANVRIEPGIEHAAAIRQMRAAGVLVVLLSQVDAGMHTMTGKVFEYLAAKRPILVAGPPSAAGELIEEAHAGISASLSDERGLRDSITRIATLSLDPEFSGPARGVLSRYDRAQQSAVWGDLLKALLRRGVEHDVSVPQLDGDDPPGEIV